MIGTVCLNNLKAICVIGIHPRERENPQPLYFDVEMDLDFGAAAEEENVSATVDYAEVAARLIEMAQDGEFQLLETLAEEASEMLLDLYEMIEAVRLTIRKPHAVPEAGFAGVRVERTRQ